MGEQRIILTGASSGIGRALAIEYGKRGGRLVLVARREDRLRETAAEVERAGGRAVILVDDVSTPGNAERALALADERFGGVDIIIMNAALGGPSFARDFTAANAERLMEVNYYSVVRMISAALPRMLAEKRGQLVAVSSLAAYRGMPGSGAYNASKAAVTVLMESLRTELRGSGVSLTTIAPGFVRSEMTAENEFRMPFLMNADTAARRMARAIDRKTSEYRFPLPTSLLMRGAELMPNWLYDRLLGALRPDPKE
jgi:short-subunit dehydrogenase